MSRLAITRSSADGFETIHADTGALALALIPALGGKVASLRDRRSGREWLWRHPRMPYRRVEPGGSYIAEADTGGWDECFPTVAPCGYPLPPWQGAALPDHGELWSQPAELEIHESADMASLRTRWRGAALPYTFERTIVLARGAARLRAEYRVQNQADAPIAFIWCIHPLLAIEPGMRLRVPPAARFHCSGTMPPGLLAQHDGLPFPPQAQLGGRALDLAVLPGSSAAIALKLWSDPLDEGWASLAAPDGELQLRWDAALLPQLACWMNLGAWAGDGGAPYYNLGLEPCIGAQDALDDAVAQWQRFATLPPQAERAWWLEIELRAGAPRGLA